MRLSELDDDPLIRHMINVRLVYRIRHIFNRENQNYLLMRDLP